MTLPLNKHRLFLGSVAFAVVTLAQLLLDLNISGPLERFLHRDSPPRIRD